MLYNPFSFSQRIVCFFYGSQSLNFNRFPINIDEIFCRYVTRHPRQINDGIVKKQCSLIPLSLEDILKFRFVELVFRPTWLYRRMMTMGPEACRERSVAVRTPYFFSAVEMVKHSDLLLKASEMLADTVLPGGSLAAVPVPDVLHADFEPKLIWNRRTHTDPAAQWLRSLIAGSVSHKTS